MTSSLDNVSMAVFCDFENVALGVRDAQYDKFDIKLVLERLLLKGSIVVKKAYCDWDRYKNFKATMHEANFELIEIPHVRQSGKNSADIRLVVDALDLCYTKSHVDTFVIVSGDSDFSPLVSKLRENAKKVIGVGVKQSTSDLLVANCDEFIFYDDLVREIQRAAAKRETRAVQAAPARKTTREDDANKKRRDDVDTRRTTAVEIVSETFEALVAERGDSGKIWASVLKEAIKRRKPDFNEAYYGFRAFGNLLEEAQSRGLLEVGRDEKSGTFVYRGTGGGAGMGGHGALHDAPMTHDIAPAPVQPAADEPSGREPRRRTRGGRRGERRDDTDTPGLFEDGGDAMAGTVVSHDANDPVVDLPVGGGSALPYVRFDPDAMQAVARAAANAQGGDPFSRAEGNRGLESGAEGVRSNEDADEPTSGDVPAAPAPSASSRRQPRGRRNAASSRAEREEAARAGGTAEGTADANADGLADAQGGSDAAASAPSSSALSNADADVTSGAAGFLAGMDESPAPVGRRPGARAPRSPRGERRTSAPAASEAAAVAAGSAAAPAPTPASTSGDAGAAFESTGTVADTQAPAAASTGKPAAKSARKAPARSRRPRKAPEG